MISERLQLLRACFDRLEIDAFYVPKVDLFMGEYIRPCDERLEWISGFTGSAGFALISRENAWMFVDGRYTVQARLQCPDFEIIDWPENSANDIFDGIIGYDDRFISAKQAAAFHNARAVANPIDALWHDQPTPKKAQVEKLAEVLAGETSTDKIARMQTGFTALGTDGFLSNSPESAAWLLNIRGGEIAKVPAPHVMSFVDQSGLHVFGMAAPDFDLPAKFYELEALGDYLETYQGIIGYDASALPEYYAKRLQHSLPVTDPLLAAKAIKNPSEIAASYDAHLRDGRAVIRFLAWLDGQNPSTLSEIGARDKLAEFRQNDPHYLGGSFESIVGFGANGAIAHYRVDEDSNLQFDHGIFLIDSGGQYPGATTDVTRTVQIGVGEERAKTPYTEVLIGLAMISSARFPRGLSGRDIDAFARFALWQSNRDYNHGTGHGIGAGLSVHEGPQSISRRNEVPLKAGMIVSLEPGYYQIGAFGVRLENLAVIRENNGFLEFETLSFVPFDARLIDIARIDDFTKHWLNAYHQKCLELHLPHLDQESQDWLRQVTAPL